MGFPALLFMRSLAMAGGGTERKFARCFSKPSPALLASHWRGVMKSKPFAIAGVGLVLGFASPGFAQDQASQKFLQKAIGGNLAEIQMGQLAQKNGASDGIRSFGDMLVTDHAEGHKNAAAAAASLGLAPPTAPRSKQKAEFERMSKLTGAKFDREFVSTW
jgi:putative membrane protein